MTKKRLTGLLTALVILLALLSVTPALAAEEAGGNAPDSAGYIVKLQDGAAPVRMLMAGPALTPIPYAEDMYLADTLEEALAFAEIYGVEYIVEDELLFLLDEGAVAGGEHEWYIDMIGAESLWNAGYDGAGTTVAIVDSGLYAAHEDFNKQKISGADFVNYDDSEPGVGYEDATGHGTFVAGIVNAVRGNGKGVDGIASGADLLAVRCFLKSSVRTSDVIAALSYAIEEDAGVINMSFGGYYSENLVTALSTPIERARERGVILVAAAGNDGNSRIMYPAGLEGVIGVGMVDENGTVAAKSQRNDSVDITAPGFGLTGLGTATEDAYVSGSGTSYAAPVVSALAAIVRQADDTIDGEGFLTLLKESAEDKGTEGYDECYGWGLVNGVKLLTALQQERSINYELDGGEIVGDYLESYTIDRDNDAVLPATVTQENYIFAGWYADKDFSGEAVTVVPRGSVGDLTYRAKWLPEGDTNVDRITVRGIAAASDRESAMYTVELPAGTNLSGLTANDITVYPANLDADVSTPVTNNNGATWTFDVSLGGTTTYTIQITVSETLRPASSGTVTGAATPASLDGGDVVLPYSSDNLSMVFTNASGSTAYEIKANDGAGSAEIADDKLIYTPSALDASKTVNVEVSAANGVFSSQTNQSFELTVGSLPPSDSRIEPTIGSYDKNNAAGDFAVSLRLYGNSLSGILSGGTPLTEDDDFSYTEDPLISDIQQIYLKKAFLDKLPIGEMYITFQFSGGRTENSRTALLTLTVTATNASQTAPAGLGKNNETAAGADDGKITGVTTAMEYKLSTAVNYMPVTGTMITNLAPGTYHVRYAAKTGFDPSAYAAVTIDAYNPGSNGNNGSGNGGGGSPTPATSGDTTSVTVIASNLNTAIDNAVKSVGDSDDATVTISFTAPAGSSATQVTLPKAGIDSLVSKDIDALVISDSKTTLTLDQAALEAIGAKAAGDVVISMSQVPESKLTAEQKEAVNGRPVFDFNITSGNTIITDLGDGTVGVTVPYTLAGGENPNAVVVYYLDADGKLQIIENGVYDPVTKTISFRTSHFSLYVIGYHLVSFTDVPASYWGRDYIEKAAARGLISGVGNKLYQPDRSVTRTEFVQMVANVLGLPAAKSGTAEYSDVKSGAWYYDAVMNTKSAGLLEKFIGEFKPGQPITREEMSAVLAAVLKQKGIVTGVYAINGDTYTDFDMMSEEYLDDIMVVTVSELMQGVGGGRFDPQGLTTRAQAATVQIRLLEILSK